MRKLVLKILATSLSFYAASVLIQGFHIERSLTAYLVTAVVFLLFNLLVSPIVKLLFLPINLLTLGLLRWLVNVIVLYIFDLLYSGISITGYYFPGYSSSVLSLPPGQLSLFVVLILTSFVMSLVYAIVMSLFHEE